MYAIGTDGGLYRRAPSGSGAPWLFWKATEVWTAFATTECGSPHVASEITRRSAAWVPTGTLPLGEVCLEKGVTTTTGTENTFEVSTALEVSVTAGGGVEIGPFSA